MPQAKGGGMETKMKDNILLKKVNEKIATLNTSNNSIIILKGIPISLVDQMCEVCELETVIKNKLLYFMKIYTKRKFLTYEEFLMLNSFVLDQYEKIYILNNNLYMNQYPIDIALSDSVKRGLLTHFTESENYYDESFIGNIGEIIDLYDGIKEYNGYLIGTYCENKIQNDAKIHIVNLFENESIPIVEVPYNDNIEYMEIAEEADYIDLVKRVFIKPNKIYIRVINYEGDIEKLNDHISIIRKNWSNYTEILYIQAQNIDRLQSLSIERHIQIF